MAKEISADQSVQGMLLVLLHARVSRLEEKLEAGPGGLRDKNAGKTISDYDHVPVAKTEEETLQAGPGGLRDRNADKKISDHDNASVAPTDESISADESISQAATQFVDEEVARQTLAKAFHRGQADNQEAESV